MDNNWNDEKIEQLLTNAPKIRDHRSKEEVLARLKADIRTQPEKKQRKFKWIPATVSVAALVTISILVVSVFNQSNNSVMQDADSKMEMSSEPAEESLRSTEEHTELNNENETNSLFSQDDQSQFKTAITTESLKTAVYPEDIVDSTIFHIGLQNDQAETVPITFVIPNAQIREDFGDAQPNSLELYKKYADRIDEEALGFSEYHPYKGTLTAENGSIIHTLPEGHGYDISSATIGAYTSTINATFYGFDDIIFKNEDGTIASFDHIGKLEEPMKLTSGISHKNYYLIVQGDGSEYLAPYAYTYKTIEEALLEMKTKNSSYYKSLIPMDINFNVVSAKGTTIIKFKELLDLEQMEPKTAMQMIEGMLLTAASFGEQIQFENVVQTDWNGFDFTQPLPKPIGPNYKEFILK